MDQRGNRIATVAACLAIAVAAGAIAAVAIGLLRGWFEPGGWLAAVFGPCLSVLALFGLMLWRKHDSADTTPDSNLEPEVQPSTSLLAKVATVVKSLGGWV